MITATTDEQVFSGILVYEDRRMRDRAMRLCDDLVRRFWADLEFDFSWWRFDYLTEPVMAHEAAEVAKKADWVVFSAHGGRELPRPIQDWIKSWMDHRTNATGALLALVGVEEDAMRGTTPIHTYLREIAQHARMDYFPHSIEPDPPREELSFNGLARRAGQVSSVLDDIIHRPAIPSRWGINE